MTMSLIQSKNQRAEDDRKIHLNILHLHLFSFYDLQVTDLISCVTRLIHNQLF